jgi:hypothetical protein
VKVTLTIFSVRDEFAEKTNVRYIMHVKRENQPITAINDDDWFTSDSINGLSRKLPFLASGAWPEIERALMNEGGFHREYTLEPIDAHKLNASLVEN